MRHAIRLGEETVSAFADAEFTSPTGESRRLNLSLVSRHVEDDWRIRRHHAAQAQRSS
ncbi:hypothetical protein [Nocardia panacis]|uniref:hypothetical protein n=1 Tax=Nocardia panacis TaxID=2340916 RepID=UPI0013968B19|nr:hypothetical protein [Nocardia panacis]